MTGMPGHQQCAVDAGVAQVGDDVGQAPLRIEGIDLPRGGLLQERGQADVHSLGRQVFDHSLSVESPPPGGDAGAAGCRSDMAGPR